MLPEKPLKRRHPFPHVQPVCGGQIPNLFLVGNGILHARRQLPGTTRYRSCDHSEAAVCRYSELPASFCAFHGWQRQRPTRFSVFCSFLRHDYLAPFCVQINRRRVLETAPLAALSGATDCYNDCRAVRLKPLKYYQSKRYMPSRAHHAKDPCAR